jgi:hypothetical protein
MDEVLASPDLGVPDLNVEQAAKNVAEKAAKMAKKRGVCIVGKARSVWLMRIEPRKNRPPRAAQHFLILFNFIPFGSGRRNAQNHA